MRRRVAAIVAGLALATPASADAAWRPLQTEGRAPAARFDHGLAATGTRSVYLFGGQRGSRSLGDLWRLDPRARRWRRLRPPGIRPEPRFGHNLLAEPGGTLLLFGGQAGSRFFGDIWRYDPAANAWTRLAPGPGPEPRYGAGAALDAAGALWITHGFTTDGRFDDTWALAGGQLADRSAAGPRPLRRCLIQAAHAAGGLFVFGGQSDPAPYRDDLWRFDTATAEWRELRPARRPSRRNRYAAAQTTDEWFIHGGAGPRGELRDLWRYHFATGAVRRLGGRGPAARSGHALAVAGSRLVLFGGATDGRERRDTWIRGL